jgi:hypothetical protein
MVGDARAGKPALYTAKQAADELGVKPVTVRWLASELQIGTKLGRDWLFTADDLDAFRNRNTTPGRPKQEQEQEG